jgi:putative ABC transport system permease protein
MLNPLFYVQAIALALAQIWANKARSALTPLGIIVGVASVTAVIAALVGLKTKILNEFETFGASRIFIFPDRPDDAPRNLYPWEKIRLTTSEVEAIAEQSTGIRAISPVTEVGMSVESESETLDGLSVVGIWPDWHLIENRSVTSGRPFNRIDEENARQVCLVNDAAITELKLPVDPVGEHILLGGRRFLIVGVVETLQSTVFGRSGNSAEVFVPFSVAEKLQRASLFVRINLVNLLKRR